MRGLYEHSGHNRRSNSGELVAKIQNPPNVADAFRGAISEGSTILPERRRQSSIEMLIQKSAVADRARRAAPRFPGADCPADENNLTNANCVPAALLSKHRRAQTAYDKIGGASRTATEHWYTAPNEGKST